MTYVRLVQMGLDLASRERARVLREEFLAQAGTSPDQLTFDFDGVRTLSDSFADELLAVLVEQKGEKWFKDHVKLLNLTPAHRQIVLSAIQARLKRAA